MEAREASVRAVRCSGTHGPLASRFIDWVEKWTRGRGGRPVGLRLIACRNVCRVMEGHVAIRAPRPGAGNVAAPDRAVEGAEFGGDHRRGWNRDTRVDPSVLRPA